MSLWHNTARTPSGIANYGMKRYITPVLPQKGGQRTGRATIIEKDYKLKKETVMTKIENGINTLKEVQEYFESIILFPNNRRG